MLSHGKAPTRKEYDMAIMADQLPWDSDQGNDIPSIESHTICVHMCMALPESWEWIIALEEVQDLFLTVLSLKIPVSSELLQNHAIIDRRNIGNFKSDYSLKIG